jgi:alpha-tubulin suppressor-like RCC1 family protein
VVTFSEDDVQMDPASETYSVNWRANLSVLSTSLTYRIVVQVGGQVVGYADLVFVANGAAKKYVDQSQFIVIILGGTTPVHFRLETGVTPPVQYTISATAGAGGTVVASTAGGPCASNSCVVAQDEQVTLTATPDAGYSFTAWTGTNCTPSGNNPLTLVNVTAACTATFVQYTISATAGPGGTVVASAGGFYCAYNICGVGQDVVVVLSAIPDANYTFSGWTGTNCTPSGDNSLLLSNVNAACTATFSGIVLSFTATVIGAGSWFTCALNPAGAAYCWGGNYSGQLGDGDIFNHNTPQAVSGGLLFSALDANNTATCALTVAGAAYCWGNNNNDWLGINTGNAQQRTPAPVVGGITFEVISVGKYHNCGLTAAGAAYCWGSNGGGKLGDGTTTDRTSPVAVLGGHTFTSITTGGAHTCALTAAGVGYCWGANVFGPLGDGTTTARSIPTLISGGLTFTSISAGDYHTCAVATGGAAYCWGGNQTGQLGNGTTTEQHVPTLVTGGNAFASIDASLQHTCAITTTGAAYCWGDNVWGNLGDGTTTNSPSPVAVSGGLVFSEISTGYYHTCGITASAAYCWGQNNLYGQVGDGTFTNRNVPTLVVP